MFPARKADDPGAPPIPEHQPAAEQAAIDEVERIRAELEARTAEYDATLQRLRDVEGRLGQSQGRAQELQEQLDQARGQLRRDSERRDELAEVHADRARLLVEAEALRVRADAADRLERDRRTDRAEIDILTAELREAREQLGRFDPRALAASAQELEAVRAERDRLEVDHLAGSLLDEQLRVELGEVRRRLAEEASLHEAARGELTRSRDEAIAGREAERRASQSSGEELRARLRDAERRLVEEQARSEAESRDWRARLDAVQARFERDRQALQEEADRLVREAETLARERDAAIEQAEAARQEHPRFQAEIDRHVAEAEDARRRADELAGQVRVLQGELDRQKSDHKAALRQYDLDLVAFHEEVQQIRGELDAARDEVEPLTRERDDLAARLDEAERAPRTAEPRHRDEAPDQADAADRADLRRRLDATREELRAAMERADGLEAEVKALRDRPPLPGGDQTVGQAGLVGDLEGDRRRVEELTEQLRQARAANEQFCSILNVFGLVPRQEIEGPVP
jgi:DNA repair exonuclease SbcCD ATPase subunit